MFTGKTPEEVQKAKERFQVTPFNMSEKAADFLAREMVKNCPHFEVGDLDNMIITDKMMASYKLDDYLEDRVSAYERCLSLALSLSICLSVSLSICLSVSLSL